MPWDISYGVKSLNSALIRLMSIVVCYGYEDDVSSGCCLFVHIRSSSHTYIVKNVHDDNLYLRSLQILVVYPLLPENAFPYCSSNISYIHDIYFLYSVVLLYFIVALIPKTPKHPFTQYSHFILLLRTLFSISIIIFISRVIRLQTPAPCGIDIFISKLATNDLCTCNHQILILVL